MKSLFYFTLLFILIPALKAQVYFDVDQSVKVSAAVAEDPARILVAWVDDPRAISYDLYRRIYGTDSWGPKIGTYPPGLTQYLDTAVQIQTLYEYKVEKFVTGDVEGYGYVLSGIDMPAVHQAGELLILLTSTTLSEISPELEDYQSVLATDGWPSRLLVVEATDPISQIKSQIVAAHNNSPFSAILILGDVPVPHSGDINPDAHNDHKGAWSADIYYGDLDGTWTDTEVNNTTAATPVNHNVPGDEKWDQSFLPSDVEVAVGRVDFSNMPVFQEDEYQLLCTYLSKNINYRTKAFAIRQRAAMRNTNPWTGALGQNGIRNFSPLVSPDSITYDEWQAAFTDSYLWYYGSGGGSQTSAVQLGNSGVYAQDSFLTVFTAWFGSYFGDYNFENNYMRAVLGSGTALTAVWAGAPHWHFHTMGMGFPLGHATVITQNNDTIYTADFFPRGVHTNLLGDPSLKSYIATPPTGLNIQEGIGYAELNWAGTETAEQYYIYRRSDANQPWTLLDSTAQSITQYRDECLQAGLTYQFLVRAAELTVSPSGSFYNLSSGTTANLLVEIDYQVVADFTAELNEGIVSLNSTAQNASSILWLLPDGSTSTETALDYALTDGISETIQLVAENNCSSDTSSQQFLYTNVEQLAPIELSIYPNPATERITINADQAIDQLELFSATGSPVISLLALANNRSTIDLSRLAPGTYYLRLFFAEKVITRKLVIH